MTDCIWELQKAVFAALDGDGTLSAMVSGIYSHVPQEAAFPYVKFGDIAAENWSTPETQGIKSIVSLEVFSRERGSKETLGIMEEIKRILHGASLSMTGCSLVNIRYTASNTGQLGDGISWQGRVGFEVFVVEG